MKKTLFAVVCLLVGNSIAQVTEINEVNSFAISNGAADEAPLHDNTPMNSSKALWDIVLSSDITTAANGSVGQAGVVYVNNEIWTSMWGSDTILRFTPVGVLIEKIQIAGVTGTRSMTTDGSNVYIGANSNTIYVVDPSTYAMTGTITSSAAVASRFLTFDPTLDAGAGGFWTGNFDTDIIAISMTGAVLSSIPAATHTLTGMYGAAFDNVNAGGPYLWVFHQAGANNTQMTVVNLTTGAPTTNTRDVYTDLSATYSLSSGLAGGAFFLSGLAPVPTIIGLVQGTPVNVLVAYDAQLTSNIGLNENELSSALVYPIPASDVVNVELGEEIAEAGTVSLVDANGRIVLTQNFDKGVSSLSVALKGVQTGTYLLNVTTASSNMVRTIVVQ